MFLEPGHLLPHKINLLKLLSEHPVERMQIHLNITANLIGFVHEQHLLFDEFDVGVDVLLVGADELLLLFDDEMHEVLVFAGEGGEVGVVADWGG